MGLSHTHFSPRSSLPFSLCLLSVCFPSLLSWAFTLLVQQLELFLGDLWLLFLQLHCRKIHAFSSIFSDTHLILVLCTIPLFPLPHCKRGNTGNNYSWSSSPVSSVSFLFPLPVSFPLDISLLASSKCVSSSRWMTLCPICLKLSEIFWCPFLLTERCLQMSLFSYIEEWRNSP